MLYQRGTKKSVFPNGKKVLMYESSRKRSTKNVSHYFSITLPVQKLFTLKVNIMFIITLFFRISGKMDKFIIEYHKIFDL